MLFARRLLCMKFLQIRLIPMHLMPIQLVHLPMPFCSLIDNDRSRGQTMEGNAVLRSLVVGVNDLLRLAHR
jgi:hypothetical protein